LNAQGAVPRGQRQWHPQTIKNICQARYPDALGHEVLLESLYNHIFGITPDLEGRNYWLEQLEAGNLQRNQMIIALINGGWSNEEAQESMARFGNRVQIALDFAEYQRTHGVPLYSKLDESGQGLFRQLGSEVLKGVTSDPSSYETARARLPELVDAFLSAVETPITTMLAEVTLGPGGGEISGDGARVVIPPNALQDYASITLSRVESTEPLLDDLASSKYLVDGLPDAIEQPILLSAPITGTLSGESYLLVEYPCIPSSLQTFNSAVPCQRLIPAQQRDGNLEAFYGMDGYNSQLSSPVSDLKRSEKGLVTDEQLGFGFQIATKRTSMYSRSGNFWLTFPDLGIHNTVPDQLAEALEETLAFLRDRAGIPYSCRDTTNDPIEVQFFPFSDWGRRKADAWGYAVPSLFRSGDMIEINTKNLPSTGALSQSELSQLLATARHEFFHLVQNCYLSFFNLSRSWIAESSSVWIEMELGETGFWPQPLQSPESLRFMVNGLFNPEISKVKNPQDEKSTNEHGYSSSLFLRYLAKSNYGFMGRLWQNINNKGSLPSIFNEAFTDDLSAAWEEFVGGVFYARNWFDRPANWDWYEMVSSMDDPGNYYNIRADTRGIETRNFISHPISAQVLLFQMGSASFAPDEEVGLSIRAKGLVDGVKLELISANGSTLDWMWSDGPTILHPNLQNFLSIQDRFKRAFALLLVDSRNPDSSSAVDIAVDVNVFKVKEKPEIYLDARQVDNNENEFEFDISVNPTKPIIDPLTGYPYNGIATAIFSCGSGLDFDNNRQVFFTDGKPYISDKVRCRYDNVTASYTVKVELEIPFSYGGSIDGSILPFTKTIKAEDDTLVTIIQN
jgi:hypothetical protein